jgi:magnesium-dependent phosphatase 1
LLFVLAESKLEKQIKRMVLTFVLFVCCWKRISGFAPTLPPAAGTTTTSKVVTVVHRHDKNGDRSSIFGMQAATNSNDNNNYAAAAAGDDDDDDEMNTSRRFPKLIVLDLDNTLWTPELYQLRKHQSTGQIPKAGKDVQLFPGAKALLERIRANDTFPTTMKVAVASRTKSVDWAHDLLTQFQLRDLLDHVEIFPGDKQAHFQNLHRDSGIAFRDMMFFDDARDGKFGNCVPVSALGVLSVHCPRGLQTEDSWKIAFQRYQEWDQSPNTIVEWDGTMTNLRGIKTNGGPPPQQQQHHQQQQQQHQQAGTIKMVNLEKRFGFIQLEQPLPSSGQRGESAGSDVFFHFSCLPVGVTSVEKGDRVQCTMEMDPKTNGKLRAASIQLASHGASSSTSSTTTTTTSATIRSMAAFSMNMPFAALLANGYKTLESRNGTMFQPYLEGTQMLLHVGRRIYPDGNRHVEILKDAGLSDENIVQLKSLPATFGPGMVVAILELGKTYDTTTEAERSTPQIQRQICAYGSDSGRRLTEIKRVAYLKRPIPLAAQGGVFHVPMDPSLVPDGWTLPATTAPAPASQAYKVPSTSSASPSSQTRTAGRNG